MKTSLAMTRKEKIIRTFKISIYAGLVFGLLISIKYGPINGVIACISFSIIWGVLVGSALFIIESNFINAKDRLMLPEKKITVYYNKETAFNYCIEAIENIKIINKKYIAVDKFTIEAITKQSILSFGEIINIDVNERENEIDSSIISIKSCSAVKKTAFDYGKNIKNVKEVASAILKEVNKGGASGDIH